MRLEVAHLLLLLLLRLNDLGSSAGTFPKSGHTEIVRGCGADHKIGTCISRDFWEKLAEARDAKLYDDSTGITC